MTEAERKAAEVYWRTRIARDVEALLAPLGSRRAAESYNHGVDAAVRVVRGQGEVSA